MPRPAVSGLPEDAFLRQAGDLFVPEAVLGKHVVGVLTGSGRGAAHGDRPAFAARERARWRTVTYRETLVGAERAARAWARSAAAEMHSSFQTLRNTCSMTCGQRVVLREKPAALERDLARLQTLWLEGLSRFGGPFLSGQVFTGVDAFFAPVAFRLQTYHLSLGTECDAYAARLLALPPMREWYAAALREPWREAAHEREIIDVAAEIVDLRQTELRQNKT